MFSGVIEGGAKCGDNDLPGVFVSLTDKTVLDFVQVSFLLNDFVAPHSVAK
jgi:hypothetical protein